MYYFSSSKSLYTVFINHMDSIDREKIMDWCRDNIVGQLMVIGGGHGSMTLKCYTQPDQNLDHFGRRNNFSEKNDSVAMMLGFTEQSDLTAFLIMFESIPRA